MKKILLPVHDPNDLATLEVGISVAQRLERPLEILHVHEQEESEVPLKELQSLLKRAKEQSVEAELVVSFGKPIKEIVRAAQHIDLIVLKHRTYMNTIGSGLIRLGDIERAADSVSPVTKQVVKKVSLPTLVTFGVASKMRHPIFAYNGSWSSTVAMRNALLLMAHRMFRRGVVVYVGKVGDKANEAMKQALQLGRDFDVELETCIIDGEPAHELLEAAVRFDADMLVMGAYGRSWIEYAVFGSVLDAILNQSTIPVFLA